MRKLLFVVTLLLVMFTHAQTVPFEVGQGLPEGVYQVLRVIDGDTLVVTHEGLQRSVRVLGLDTPELQPLQPGALEAKLVVTQILMMAGSVQLTPGAEPIDRFGRALAYVTLPEGGDLSLLLLVSGYAKPMGGGAREAIYAAAAAGARSVGKGLWADNPERFRDRNCADFRTRLEASAFFLGARTEARPDPHQLDRDGNLKVCDRLPPG